MNPHQFAIWGAALASALQTTYYSALLQQNDMRSLLQSVRSGSYYDYDTIQRFRMSPVFGRVLGFLLAWPVAHHVGRRNGLILSNLLLPTLAIIFQWSAFLLSSSHHVRLLVPSRLCIGLHVGSLPPLYYLHIFETRPKAWRPLAILSYFLLSHVLVDWLSVLVAGGWIIGGGDYFTKDDDERWWPSWLLTLALIPAGIQIGALLVSVESPGFSAVQRANPAKARTDATKVLRLPSSSSSGLVVDELQLELMEIGPTRKLTFQLSAISLLLVALGGSYCTDRNLEEILRSSSFFIEWSHLVSTSLYLGLIVVGWGTAFIVASKLPGKVLLFGSLTTVSCLSFARILVALSAVLADLSSVGSSRIWWTLVAWTVYILDLITAPVSNSLIMGSLTLLLLELGDQRRRAGLMIPPLALTLLLPLTFGNAQLVGYPDFTLGSPNTLMYEPDTVWTRLGKWGGRLVAHVGMALGIRWLWRRLERIEGEQKRLPPPLPPRVTTSSSSGGLELKEGCNNGGSGGGGEDDHVGSEVARGV